MLRQGWDEQFPVDLGTVNVHLAVGHVIRGVAFLFQIFQELLLGHAELGVLVHQVIQEYVHCLHTYEFWTVAVLFSQGLKIILSRVRRTCPVEMVTLYITYIIPGQNEFLFRRSFGPRHDRTH